MCKSLHRAFQAKSVKTEISSSQATAKGPASIEESQAPAKGPGPQVIKLFFMLNSVKHEILNAHKYKSIKKFGLYLAKISLDCYISRSLMLKCQQLLAF